MEAATDKRAGARAVLGRAGLHLDLRSARERASELVEAFEEHDLLIQASALAFRVLLAAIPTLLFLTGLIGFFNLASIWHDHLAPTLRASVSPPAFKLVAQAVDYVLHNQQLFWVTAGAVIATLEMSGIVRGVANVLNRIYEAEDDRPRVERLTNSLWVGATVGALLVAAIAAVWLLPAALASLLGDGWLTSTLGEALGLSIAALFLLAAIALMVRVGPDVRRPLGWVTFGAVLVVVGWIAMTAVFAFYVSDIASYGTVFGNLATAFIALEYLFLLAVVFLGGLVLDALAEGRTES